MVRSIGKGGLAIAAALAAARDAAAAEGGLVLVPDPALLVLLVAAFALLVAPANRLLFRPIFRVLDERDARIAGTRRRAEELAAEADALLQRYEESVEEVREQAEGERKGTLSQARSEHAARTASARGQADDEVARARSELNAALEQARTALRQQSREIADRAAERVLGRSLS